MGIKVLVVDDAPFIREVLAQMLTSAGMSVVGEATDGKYAVKMAQESDPDLILMDLVMPRMSGIEATQEILKMRPEQKIIACSTLDQQTLVMRAIDAGCIHYINKPFKKEELLRVIETAMEKK
jgi:two-component system chemotaxis response regulator CheY